MEEGVEGQLSNCWTGAQEGEFVPILWHLYPGRGAVSPSPPTSWHNTEFTRTTQEGGTTGEKECYTSRFQPLVQQSYFQHLLVRLVEQK